MLPVLFEDARFVSRPLVMSTLALFSFPLLLIFTLCNRPGLWYPRSWRSIALRSRRASLRSVRGPCPGSVPIFQRCTVLSLDGSSVGDGSWVLALLSDSAPIRMAPVQYLLESSWRLNALNVNLSTLITLCLVRRCLSCSYFLGCFVLPLRTTQTAFGSSLTWLPRRAVSNSIYGGCGWLGGVSGRGLFVVPASHSLCDSSLASLYFVIKTVAPLVITCPCLAKGHAVP